jgi:hypothetical protein
MGREISFIQYMRAHGNTPGPTQRPYLNGALSGFTAAIPSLLVFHYSGASDSVALKIGMNLWLVLLLHTSVLIVGGMIYAAIFKRAANDCKGGWLFGISYGFLLWMLGPVTLWETVTSLPLAVGTAAMGLFAAQLVFGLLLGLTYPRMHALVQKRLNNAGGAAQGYG